MVERFTFTSKSYHWDCYRESEKSQLAHIERQWGKPLKIERVVAGDAILIAMEHPGEIKTYLTVIPDDCR